MTVPNSTNRDGPYSGNGVTTVFDRTFLAKSESVVAVYLIEDGVETRLVNGFTHTGIGDPVGTVVFSTPPSSGQQIVLIRQSSIEQQSDYVNQGRVPPEQIEADLDNLVLILQDLQEKVGRAVTLGLNVDGSAGAAQLGAIAAQISQQSDLALAATADALAAADGVSSNATLAQEAANLAAQSSTTAVASANQAAGSATAASVDRQTATTAASQASVFSTQAATAASEATGAAATATSQTTVATQRAGEAANSATIAQTAASGLGALIALRAKSGTSGAELELVAASNPGGAANSIAKLTADIFQVQTDLSIFGGAIEVGGYVSGVSGIRLDENGLEVNGNLTLNGEVVGRNNINAADRSALRLILLADTGSLAINEFGSDNPNPDTIPNTTLTFPAGTYATVVSSGGSVVNPLEFALSSEVFGGGTGNGVIILQGRISGVWQDLQATAPIRYTGSFDAFGQTFFLSNVSAHLLTGLRLQYLAEQSTMRLRDMSVAVRQVNI